MKAKNEVKEKKNDRVEDEAVGSAWGVCVICNKQIYTSFYRLHTAKDDYGVRVHTRCYDALTGARV